MLEFERIIIEYIPATEEAPAKLGYFKDHGDYFDALRIYEGDAAEIQHKIITSLAQEENKDAQR